MSEVQQANPQEAFNVLQNEVANNVFFQKLAQYGIEPSSPQEAQAMIELSGKLRNVDEQVKEASADDNIYAQASNALDGTLEQHGFQGQSKQAAAAEADQSYAEFARGLAADPKYYNAVLTVKQAQADAVMAQLQ